MRVYKTKTSERNHETPRGACPPPPSHGFWVSGIQVDEPRSHIWVSLSTSGSTKDWFDDFQRN